MKPSPRAVRVAAVCFVVVMLGVAHRLGILERFADPPGVARSLVELGAWGYLAFVVAYAALQPFGVPGTVFVVAAPLIWPWPVAYGLSMTGTMAASVVGFSFSRLVARDWIAGIIPERFRRYDDALERRAFATVFTLRFIFWMPPLLHAFFGVSKVRFWTHFWASLAGYTVPLLVVSYFGARAFEAMKHAPPSVWIGVVAAVVVAVAAAWWVRSRRAR